MIGPPGTPSEGGWNGFNVLHTAASRVAGLDLGFLPERTDATSQAFSTARAGEIDLVYLLGADEIDMNRLGRAFVIYQGTHGDAGAHRADVVLPGAAYTEKAGLYVNLEGRVQLAERATFPPGEGNEDWAILRALSGAMGQPLPYDMWKHFGPPSLPARLTLRTGIRYRALPARMPRSGRRLAWQAQSTRVGLACRSGFLFDECHRAGE